MFTLQFIFTINLLFIKKFTKIQLKKQVICKEDLIRRVAPQSRKCGLITFVNILLIHLYSEYCILQDTFVIHRLFREESLGF